MHPDVAVAVARSVFGGAPVIKDWRELAMCQDSPDKDSFFGRSAATQAAARRACQGCPVKPSCLAFALSMTFNPHGVWGGTTAWERTRLRRRSGGCYFCQECGDRIWDSDGSAWYCSQCRRLTAGRENVAR